MSSFNLQQLLSQRRQDPKKNTPFATLRLCVQLIKLSPKAAKTRRENTLCVFAVKQKDHRIPQWPSYKWWNG
jgi:hypothetical protein